jgi:hypothetical protein
LLSNCPLVEVTLEKKEDFLRICETLSRIGIASKKDKTLYQTCHILHKKGRYYIVHFLEMFILDGKCKNFGPDDIARRNTIISLLEKWGLLKVVDPDLIKEPQSSMRSIMVIPFVEKTEWNIKQKYTIGKIRV